MEAKYHNFMPIFEINDLACDLQQIIVTESSQLPLNTSQKQTHEDFRIIYLCPQSIKNFIINTNSYVCFSQAFQKRSNYIALATKVLASSYKFNRKSKPEAPLTVRISTKTSQAKKIIHLAQLNIKTRQLANSRGDVEGSSQYFINLANKVAIQHNLKLTVFKGNQLSKEGFRLHHAVGRASKNQPVFVNIAYKGNDQSQEWLALVGKGILFDSGGLNLKDTDSITNMFLDKHAACSCFVAFEAIVKSQLKINVTVSLGFAENFISSNSYRPSDIIKSRKGLTIKIADTDAEGRLVLADAMNWTQENYKIDKMIEISTLTYSCMKGLGRFHAGVYSNNQAFQNFVLKIGKQVGEQGWPMPLTEDHHQMLKCPEADCVSDVDDCPGGSLGAAFLQKFVQAGVKWIHLDVLGVSIFKNESTGWGAKILYSIVKQLQQFPLNKLQA